MVSTDIRMSFGRVESLTLIVILIPWGLAAPSGLLCCSEVELICVEVDTSSVVKSCMLVGLLRQ